MFTSHTLLFLLGVTESFSDDVLRLVVAVWFFSVSYLLAKRLDRSRSLATAAGQHQILRGDSTIATQP